MWGVCDQLCEDRIGSHHCSCREGYALEQHRHCRADISSECNFLSVSAVCFTDSVLAYWMFEWSIQMSITIDAFPFWSPWLLPFTVCVHSCMPNIVLVSLLPLWNIERVLTKSLWWKKYLIFISLSLESEQFLLTQFVNTIMSLDFVCLCSWSSLPYIFQWQRPTNRWHPRKQFAHFSSFTEQRSCSGSGLPL